MARPMLVTPGARSQRVRLIDILRESHEAWRAERLAEIEKRTAIGVPLDDKTKWGVVDGHLATITAARTKHDSATIVKECAAVINATAGHAIVDPGEFKADAFGVDLSGVEVVMAIPDEAQALDWTAERIAIAEKQARAQGDTLAVRETAKAWDELLMRIVSAVVVEVHGVEGLVPGDVAKHIRAIHASGILGALFSAAQAFMDLPLEKKSRCGQPAQST